MKHKKKKKNLKKYSENKEIQKPSHKQEHRVSSPLELFFDLVYVIAMSALAWGLHHSLVEWHILSGILMFLQTFFSIWWSWMNYSWFSLAYDPDDSMFKILTFVQIFWLLIFTSGISSVFSENPQWAVWMLWLVIMRIVMIIQWVRAAKFSPENREVCMKYAYWLWFLQILWIIKFFFLPETWIINIILTILLIFWELAVPIYAERTSKSSPWHSHHIAERYSLLLIIILWEWLWWVSKTIIALTWLENGLFVAFWVWFFATAIVFAIWWASFQFSWGNILDKVRWSLKIMAFWYWHYFLFASIAWIWISLELVADWAKNYYLNSWWEHSVTAFFAICVLCSFVGIYFLVNSLMRIILIQKNKYQIYTIFIWIWLLTIPAILVYFWFDLILALSLVLSWIIVYILLTRAEHYCKIKNKKLWQKF